MEEITKEDVFKLISASAMQKIEYLFETNNNDENENIDEFETYITEDGIEYYKWDVPLFVMLDGRVNKTPPTNILARCIDFFKTRGFEIDIALLANVFNDIQIKCKEEEAALLFAYRQFDQEENIVDIYNNVKYMLH